MWQPVIAIKREELFQKVANFEEGLLLCLGLFRYSKIRAWFHLGENDYSSINKKYFKIYLWPAYE